VGTDTRILAAESATKSGITISGERLRNTMGRFCFSRGLRKKRDRENWLKLRALSQDDAESHFETDVLIDLFKDVRSRNAVKEKYLACPQAQPVIRKVIYRKLLAEQFRQAR